MKVFCLPYSGTGASLYSAWPEEVCSLQIIPLQLPGKENRFREARKGSFEELAEWVINEYLTIVDCEYNIYGHCSSALLAYEIVSQLEQSSLRKPKNLFVSAQPSPSLGPSGPMLNYDDDELISMIHFRMGKENGQIQQSFLQLMLSDLKQDIELHRNYSKKKVELKTKISVLAWENDEFYSVDQLKSWSELGEVSFHVLSGGHYEFKKAPAELLNLFISSF